MHLLLSGEGPSDIGVCNTSADSCDANTFNPGPMSWVIDQLVGVYQGFDCSYLEHSLVSNVTESYLANNKLKPLKRAVSLRGKKTPVETKYYYENARMLAIAAKAKSKELSDDVIAILFRDADGTASSGRGDWSDKRASMIKGFSAEGFNYGVAMLPNPKSEAWLLCAVKDNPYQHCQQLEDESGNDKGASPLKDQLSEALNGKNSTVDLNQLLQDGTIDPHSIDMPSYNQFKQDLESVVKSIFGGRA